ncbi:hypothetical protein [Falsiroseomonas ponticola]|uniref:hypothetical protein n=1 Tax=Falsiroseomonas ponticola TaxID=2786951 RepID=UPI00193162D9|nr:hypothetical protein [Roseomonas ponticola]
MTPPPSILGQTRWEWVGAGIRFRLWTRPVVGQGGRSVVPVTLLWRRPDGTGGMARCDGLIEAMARVEAVMAEPAAG